MSTAPTPARDVRPFDAAARIAHERLMWTSGVNGAGQPWEALTEEQRDGWREYVAALAAALPAAAPAPLPAERVRAAADAMLATPWSERMPDGRVRTSDPHVRGHYDPSCAICRPDIGDGAERIVRRVAALLDVPVEGGEDAPEDPRLAAGRAAAAEALSRAHVSHEALVDDLTRAVLHAAEVTP